MSALVTWHTMYTSGSTKEQNTICCWPNDLDIQSSISYVFGASCSKYHRFGLAAVLSPTLMCVYLPYTNHVNMTSLMWDFGGFPQNHEGVCGLL